MNEKPEAAGGRGASSEQSEPLEPSPYIRLPLPLVAGALLVLIVGVLAVGLYASRNFRTPSAVSVVEVTPTSIVAASTAGSTPVLPVVAATAAVATATLAPTPLIIVIAASATPTAPLPVASPSPTVLPTVEPTLAAEVGKAYERYWRIRAEALLALDKTHLVEAMAGDHLTSTLRLIDELRSENRAIKTDVDHDYHVVVATQSSANVYDDYLSSSFYVDPVTHEAISDPSSDELKVLYTLAKSDGIWKVVDSVRAE